MRSIHIPELRHAPEQARELEIQDYLPDLETLTPVKGWLRVVHQGTYLEVTAEVVAIVTLTCHRCLQQYNHRLDVEAKELIWLEEPAAPEVILGDQEVAFEDFVETLSPNGEFQPLQWLYEQCCLALPRRQLCDPNCVGIAPAAPTTPSAPALVDQRWAALAALHQDLNLNN